MSEGSEESAVEIHGVNKGIRQRNPGLCLLYLGTTVLLSEPAASQATSGFIFMTPLTGTEGEGGRGANKSTTIEGGGGVVVVGGGDTAG